MSPQERNESSNEDFDIRDILDPHHNASDPLSLAESMSEGDLHDYIFSVNTEISNIDVEIATLLNKKKRLQVESSCAKQALAITRDRGLE